MLGRFLPSGRRRPAAAESRTVVIQRRRVGGVDDVVDLEDAGRVERLAPVVGGGHHRLEHPLTLGLVGDGVELAAEARGARRPPGPCPPSSPVGQATQNSGALNEPPAMAWAPRP